MKPDQLQLGFLKVLKGSYMKEQEVAYGLIHKSRPPYEVLFTNWLSYGDVRLLKGVEEMVEVYYNSRQFTHTIEYMGTWFSSAFDMFEKMWKYYERQGFQEIQHKRSARYDILLSFISEEQPCETGRARELLIYDYYLRENAKTRPAFAGEYQVRKEDVRAFYESDKIRETYLPGYAGRDRNQVRRMTHLEYFPLAGRYVLFDYLERNPLNQEARTCIIESKKEKKDEF